MHVLVYGMVGNHRGGIESFLLKMNEYMSKNTIFDYVIEEDSCIHEDIIRKRNGNIYFISSRHFHPIKNIQDNKELLQKLKYSIDVVYFNLSSLSWIEPIKMAVKIGYSVFVHSHNAEFIKANGNSLYRIMNWINKRRLHHMNVTRLTCSLPATKFMFCNSDLVTMIYNAIDVEKFKYNPLVRKEQRNKLGISENTLVLGFVGRLQYQKNPMYLPIILKSVLETCPNVIMLIVGEGELRTELEEKFIKSDFSKHVKFLGNIPNVNEVMQAMDALVLPSFHEGLPYVMIEAQAAGLPCFVANTVTNEAKITDKVYYLPLSGNAEEWQKAINTHMGCTDRTEYFEIVSRSSFNIKREAKKLEDLFHAIW